jgi:formylglycine-generating enzyme required for sulfatase activity
MGSRVVAGLLVSPVLACGASPARAPGKLLLRADLAAYVAVDGRRMVDLAAGELRALVLPRGVRRVRVVSADGAVAWEQTVAVGPTPVVRLVSLTGRLAELRRDYVRIPAGRFEMGCVEGDLECGADEQPRHAVEVSRGFRLMRTEVSVRDYQAFAEATGRPMPPAPPFNAGWKWKTHPMVNVTWTDAATYCERAGGRLPTEAEWEYSARGGQAGWRYVWGDDPRPVAAGYKQANLADQRGRGSFEVEDGPWFESYDDGYSRTSPAFQYSPNGFGLFDMAGNAAEWCADRYGGDQQVVRGGSWRTGVTGARVSNRTGRPPEAAGEDVGFRCARDDHQPPEAAADALPPAPPGPLGRLGLAVDVAASLAIDGKPAGEMTAGEPRLLDLERGEHLLRIATPGGEAGVEQVVEVGPAPSQRTVELAREQRRVREEYVRVAAGSFEMGCVAGDEECESAERPGHRVTISRDFWMMKTEVTVAAYRAFVAATGRAMPPESEINPGWALADHPVMNLTWEDAAAYCAWVGGRLPTEAEWEYAARAGHHGWRYGWGPQPTPIRGGRKQANVGDERAKRKVGCPQCGWFDGYDDGYVYTAPVASFEPNGLGLHDMAGNVIEWCADFYRERYYQDSPAVDPPGSEFGRWRVLRGGSWSMGPKGLRTSYRGGFPPDRTTDNYGARCVREVAAP